MGNLERFLEEKFNNFENKIVMLESSFLERFENLEKLFEQRIENERNKNSFNIGTFRREFEGHRKIMNQVQHDVSVINKKVYWFTGVIAILMFLSKFFLTEVLK